MMRMNTKSNEVKHIMSQDSGKKDLIRTKGKFGPISSTTLNFKLTPLQKRIISIANELMDNRYLLDSELLYARCVRFLKDVDVRAINSALKELLRNKILVDGKAVTRLNILENENRGLILALIKNKPGLNLTKIARELGINITTVRWHLNMLERFELIRVVEISENSSFYFDFYLKKVYDRLLIALNKKNMKLIVKAIHDHEKINFLDLLDFLDLPRTTLTRKVKKLITLDLIKKIEKDNQDTVLSLDPAIEKDLHHYIFS